MTPEGRERIESAVKPAWERAGSPHSGRFHVNLPPRMSMRGVSFQQAPRTMQIEFCIAEVRLECGEQDGRPSVRLVAAVDSTDIEIVLRQEFV